MQITIDDFKDHQLL